MVRDKRSGSFGWPSAGLCSARLTKSDFRLRRFEFATLGETRIAHAPCALILIRACTYSKVPDTTLLITMTNHATTVHFLRVQGYSSAI